MSLDIIISLIGGVLLLLVIGTIIFKRRPRKLKMTVFVDRWKELQTYCKQKETWPEALTRADKLLDEALKKRRFKGKSMGERLVSAGNKLTNNDGIWFAHNLYKKIIDDESVKLAEKDVKQALMAFRQALKDIGALPASNDNNEKQET